MPSFNQGKIGEGIATEFWIPPTVAKTCPMPATLVHSQIFPLPLPPPGSLPADRLVHWGIYRKTWARGNARPPCAYASTSSLSRTLAMTASALYLVGMDRRRTTRGILEIGGGFVAVAVHVFFGLLYMMGWTLSPFDRHPALYWTAVALPFLLMAGVALARRRIFRNMADRWVYTTWLMTFMPALVLAVLALRLNWPISLKGWDGHGIGASGGEGNAMLLPWLHVLFWVVLGRYWPLSVLKTAPQRPFGTPVSRQSKMRH